MMLGVSGMLGSSGEGGSAAEHPHESGGASGGSSEVGGPSSVALEEAEKGGGGGGGNRWPRQETLALIQIRHDMDSAFRDSSLKGPLWEEVSRKMAELGFQRNAKKCKEKFENVFKYHKRTKDGRSSKPDGKTYRFFDQLEALENTPPPHQFTQPPPPPPRSAAAPPPHSMSMPPHITINTTATAATTSINTVPSTSLSPTPISVLPPQSANQQLNPIHHHVHHRTSNSTSSSTSSDEDIQRRRRGKKRKWKDYFERLMRDIVAKQEDMQKRFLDALERRERDRVAREEAWRAQEAARANREHELLVQEMQMASAKDSAVIAFLKKVSDQHNLQIPINVAAPPPPPQPAQRAATMQARSTPQDRSQPPPPPPPMQPHPTLALQPPILTAGTLTRTTEALKADDGGGENYISTGPSGSSRWPKAEVQALINLRTSLDLKYQDNGPKGPLWEEISFAMGKIGYSRNAKRCKEKWENINKYYKKVKESKKKRPEDSKTCPYFHQLEDIYKARNEVNNPSTSLDPVGYGGRPENQMGLPIMARPEQQWPVLPQQGEHQQVQGGLGTTGNAALMQDVHHQQHKEGTENVEDEEEDDEDDDDDDDNGDDQGGGYEMIANVSTKQTTSSAVE